MTVSTDWSGYTISKSDFHTRKSIKEIDFLRHVSHLSDARTIMKQKILKPNLVQDRSRLKRSRLPVVWLSPNSWVDGPMYGTVNFEFEIKKLWKPNGKTKFYWVEVVKNYNPNAIRLLLSSRRSNDKVLKNLKPIQPNVFGQPIFIKGGKVYWDSRYCYEIMVDRIIDVSDSYSVNFERHNSQLCNQMPEKDAFLCREKSKGASINILVSLALVKGNRRIANYLRANKEDFSYEIIQPYAKSFINWLVPEMKVLNRRKSLKNTESILKAAFICLAEGYTNSAKQVFIDHGNIEVIVE